MAFKFAWKTMLFRNASTLLKSEDGNTVAEYAVMLSVICGVLLSSASMLGNSTVGTLLQIAKSLEIEPEHATSTTGPRPLKP